MDKTHRIVGALALLFAALGCACDAALAWEAEDTVVNPVDLTYERALVRLKVDLPAGTTAEQVAVSVGRRAVVCQIDEAGQVWVAATLKPLEAATYRVAVEPGRRTGPVRGAGQYDPGLSSLVEAFVEGKGAERIADGPLFRRWVVKRANFTMRLTQPVGKPWAIVEESGVADWGFVLDEALPSRARQGAMHRWFTGPFEASKGLETVQLSNDATRLRDGIVELLPRWTQSYDEGWFSAVSNGARMVGVMPLRAGRWRWPHEAKLTVRVDGEGRPVLDGAMARGARYWLLIAGPTRLTTQAGDIARRVGFAPLDKLHNEYVFGAIDEKAKPARVQDFFSNDTNPTGIVRRWGRAATSDALSGKRKADLNSVYEAQARLDPDWYGRYEDGWSPINPNFYTDFMRLAIAQAAMLQGHPAYEHVRAQAVAAFRSDLVHSVTLPGGAGQECPGYLAHAMEQWEAIAPVLAGMGYDPRGEERFGAAASFIARLSHPDGEGGRIFHPGGDTHPGRPEPIGFAAKYGVREDPSQFVTEELPGFGVVFRERSGEPNETYLAFKSGPNRGHYHGDQLSFHYIADGKPRAIDHRVSYSPRAGQEHMHNRVSFSTANVPWANMDGYERVIGFKAGEEAVIAVGQVESTRLRPVKQYPPEDWDTAADMLRFERPLKYRRSIVMLRNLPAPVFVVYDQCDVPNDQVIGTYNIHVKSSRMDREGDVIRFDGLAVHVVQPAGIELASFVTSTQTWLPEQKAGEATEGARLGHAPGSGEFLTVLVPDGARAVAVKANGGNGVDVGPYTVRFAEGFMNKGEAPDGDVAISVRRGPQPVAELRAGEIDLDRSQGEIGLFIPDVGYPFGPIPDWLAAQRAGRIEPLDLGARE